MLKCVEKLGLGPDQFYEAVARVTALWAALGARDPARPPPAVACPSMPARLDQPIELLP